MLKEMLRTKSLKRLMGEYQAGAQDGLKKALKAKDLVALGVGAVIGAGIFVTTGLAAAGSPGYLGAGPAVVLSFLLVAVACAFSAFCYAEFASMIPIAGSAYTYAYATMGELVAWIIGWDLILEYGVGNVAVAISWSGYLGALLRGVGINIPVWLSTASMSATSDILASAPHIFGLPIVFNMPAIVIVGLLTWLLVYGVSESAAVNDALVVLKIAIVIFVIVVGAFYVDPSNWTPFMPNGWAGVQAAGAMIFFAYVGFDAVSTAAEETENPARDLPIGLIGTLVICSILYILVALVLTGMMPYTELGTAEPMATAFEHMGAGWASGIISFGAIVAMTAVLLVFQLGMPRIFFSMARDGLLPKVFAKVHPKYRTPHVTTILTGVAIAVAAGFMDITTVIELCNIGTLFAFVLVCIGIPILRRTQPDAKRPFRVPFVPLFPILGVLSCLLLMVAMPTVTWIRFAVWLVIGLVIYIFYGAKHSALNDDEGDSLPTPSVEQ